MSFSIGSMLNAAFFRDYKRKHPSAETRGNDACISCGCCCWRRPSALSVDEVCALAAHFELTEQRFFKRYCMADQIDGQLIVILRRQHQSGGLWIDADESWSVASPCIFLDASRQCQIHDCKPQRCAGFKCWSKDKPEISHPQWTRNEIIDLDWNGITDE